MTLPEGKKPHPHARLASRTLDGETVIVDPQQNMVRMLNEVGSRIWELADGSRTPEQIATELAEEFDLSFGEIYADVLQFLNELDSKQLLIWG